MLVGTRGEALAKAARWRVAQARDDEELEFNRVSQTRKVEDLADSMQCGVEEDQPELPVES